MKKSLLLRVISALLTVTVIFSLAPSVFSASPASANFKVLDISFWHEEVNRARESVLLFPRDKVGTCVLDKDGSPFTGDASLLSAAMESGDVVFHEGRICGAWPQIAG